MNEIHAKINESAALADLEISATEGTLFAETPPILATPAAFLGGVAVSSAVVTAFDAGLD